MTERVSHHPPTNPDQNWPAMHDQTGSSLDNNGYQAGSPPTAANYPALHDPTDLYRRPPAGSVFIDNTPGSSIQAAPPSSSIQ